MIEINNLTTNKVDEKFLKGIAEKVLKDEDKKDIELSIALVGWARIRKLNKQYRKKNKVTDVLSFQYASERSERSGEERQSLFEGISTEGAQGQKEHEVFFKDACAGEIVICLREVKKNAKRANIALKKELTRVLIHGILHLLGYDHEKSKIEAEKMREKEETYVKNVK